MTFTFYFQVGTSLQNDFHCLFSSGHLYMKLLSLSTFQVGTSIWNDFDFLISSGHLYAATVADFSGTDSLIIKDSLRTEQYDYKHLNGKFLVIIIKDRLRDEVIIITVIINAL